ncbi:DUF1405 domain-containing protein [Microaerobacter geothermalis]|uniref:DUF1405 domain-containing protein n=1 Tax=Microaerobacter geothermalis TaxID=674972 RepID=UPI001F3C9C8C|nr:DUF1405 domain-containing protein [Microaerobacter geothermalis]MCF6093360.1 DUF1405 domain-containing protein [Microaerobacter geothermalis]
MCIWNWLKVSLMKKWFLWTLFIINFLGTIYGFIWYKNQLINTSPGWLRFFVPDSPTASGLFTLVLLFFIIGKHFPTIEALAAVTQVKYGIWAVGIILAGALMGDNLVFTDYMLMFSHGGMAIEALLYSPYYRFKGIHLLIASIWVLWNDGMDYLLDIHPWLPGIMEPFDHIVGWATLILSFFSIWMIFRFGTKHI